LLQRGDAQSGSSQKAQLSISLPQLPHFNA
jgi:hypothetical protein